MLGFTTNQLAILFLVLLLGWLLGLISRSGKKWRVAYEAERDARIEEQRENAAQIGAANARIAELERQLRRLQASVEPLLRAPASAAGSDDWADAVQPAVAKVVPRARKRASRATSAVAPTAKPAKAAKPAKPRVRKPRA